jgi:formimidoylglutamate deiminase
MRPDDLQPECLWAPQAWLDGRWHEQVVLQVGSDGHWAAITPGQPCPAHATVLAGAALPGLVDAHSHAFQRAFVALAETREGEHDDFWSWRDRMYRVALRITPAQLRAVAAHLFVELLRGGYTQVCEFHYLQHAPDGARSDDPATLCWALADAAAEAGIGLTLLPVLYERAGFAQPQLRDDQRRFATSAQDVLALQRAVANANKPLTSAGVAVHSLRAARPESLLALSRGAGEVPVHIHVAEQTAEVDDCLVATGCRPIEWLAHHAGLDARWQLVHATHSTPAEIDAVARSGAGVVLCPGTEANLGDGLADVPLWLAAGVPLSIGSDSQVTRSWSEELRWLEYGQRLGLRQRNVAANPAAGQPSSAARLFECMRSGGAAAAGFTRWGLMPGARADLLVLNAADPALLGIAHARALDAAVFAAPAQPFSDVMVAGRWRLRGLRHASEAELSARFVTAMRELA